MHVFMLQQIFFHLPSFFRFASMLVRFSKSCPLCFENKVVTCGEVGIDDLLRRCQTFFGNLQFPHNPAGGQASTLKNPPQTPTAGLAGFECRQMRWFWSFVESIRNYLALPRLASTELHFFRGVYLVFTSSTASSMRTNVALL